MSKIHNAQAVLRQRSPAAMLNCPPEQVLRQRSPAVTHDTRNFASTTGHIRNSNLLLLGDSVSKAAQEGRIGTAREKNADEAANLKFDFQDSSTKLPGDSSEHPFKGLVLLLLSCVGFSAMSLMVKLASNRFGAAEAYLFRSFVQLCVSGLACRYHGIPVWGPEGLKFRCLLRGFIGGSSTFCFVLAIARLPLGDATAIYFVSPVFTVLFCFCVGFDRVTRSDIIAVIFGIAGVILISQPSFLFPDSLKKKFLKQIFGQIARCERRIMYITLFWTNFEQNCHQNTKQDSGQISNLGFRIKNQSSFRNSKSIFAIEASYSSRFSFRDIKIRILRPRFGRNLHS
jgi:uncharacterized membrane protein